jgi:hypothetical protein
VTIRRLLKDSKLGAQEQQMLKLAYRLTLKSMSLVDRDDVLCEIIARKVIEIGERGVTNVIAISEIALRELGPYRK